MELYGEKYNIYLIVPLLLFIAFLFLIFIYPTVPVGMDLKGGTMYIIRSSQPMDSEHLEQLLNAEFPLRDLQVNTISSPTGSTGLTIQFAENTILSEAEGYISQASNLKDSDAAQAAQSALQAIELLVSANYIVQPETAGLDADDLIEVAKVSLANAEEFFHDKLINIVRTEYSLGQDLAYQKREVGPTLGVTFWESAMLVGAVAFILIIIIIFLFFREIIPSAAVIAAAAFDICGALALMSIFGIPLSLSSIPALLMLVGYSVDTDIMLTTRLLKRMEKSPRLRTLDAMKTGLTMTFTTLAAVSGMLVLSYYAQMFVVFEIAAVLMFGLAADVISTWMMNAPLLLWYVEKVRKGVVLR